MRHIMEPDPDRPTPSLRTVLWIYASILAVVIFVALLAKAHGN